MTAAIFLPACGMASLSDSYESRGAEADAGSYRATWAPGLRGLSAMLIATGLWPNLDSWHVGNGLIASGGGFTLRTSWNLL